MRLNLCNEKKVGKQTNKKTIPFRNWTLSIQIKNHTWLEINNYFKFHHLIDFLHMHRILLSTSLTSISFLNHHKIKQAVACTMMQPTIWKKKKSPQNIEPTIVSLLILKPQIHTNQFYWSFKLKITALIKSQNLSHHCHSFKAGKINHVLSFHPSLLLKIFD